MVEERLYGFVLVLAWVFEVMGGGGVERPGQAAVVVQLLQAGVELQGLGAIKLEVYVCE